MKSSELEQNVFIVDNEQKVCDAIFQTLKGPGINVTCFNNATDCLEQLRKSKCDLLITDLKMPHMDGLELLTKAKSFAPWLPVLVITGYGDIPIAVKTVKAGAVDFIEKPLIKKDFLRQVNNLLEENKKRNAHLGTPLTKGESRVLQLIVNGKTNKQIADILHRSVRTIEVHRSRIMDKLGAENLIDLLKRAASMGLFDLPTEPDQGTKSPPTEKRS